MAESEAWRNLKFELLELPCSIFSKEPLVKMFFLDSLWTHLQMSLLFGSQAALAEWPFGQIAIWLAIHYREEPSELPVSTAAREAGAPFGEHSVRAHQFESQFCLSIYLVAFTKIITRSVHARTDSHMPGKHFRTLCCPNGVCTLQNGLFSSH